MEVLAEPFDLITQLHDQGVLLETHVPTDGAWLETFWNVAQVSRPRPWHQTGNALLAGRAARVEERPEDVKHTVTDHNT